MRKLKDEVKRQIFKIKKNDWSVFIKRSGKLFCMYFATKKEAVEGANAVMKPGDEVQIFRLSYEFKDSFVVGEK